MMSIDKSFRTLSYAAVLCGFAALVLAGTFGPVGVLLFLAVFGLSIWLERTGWQMSEFIGTGLTVLAIPVYYLLWRSGIFANGPVETMLPGILARLILTLTAIKLLQRKGVRDWIFLYVMAFFQILLAAGLSISPLYFGSFVAFILVMAAAVILLDIRRTQDALRSRAKLNAAPVASSNTGSISMRRLPATAISLVVLIVIFAVPLFFMLPRVGGAGIGGSLGGVSTFSGFSDQVRLGGIGRIQENDAVVMRVRIENRENLTQPVRWRGIALDTFDNRSWSRSRPGVREPRARGDRDLIQVDYATGRDSLVVQTVYLEPLDTQVLFALTRPVAVQANFPHLNLDSLGSITFPRSGERSTYKVLSDPQLPPANDLHRDRSPYPKSLSNYLQLPEDLDPRIVERAEQLTETARSRLEAAELVEFHLKNDFGYTLEQKAGGDQPLSDFLFNVREGHCEYFATAMAVMLRTQGIATRVVNGFQQGEYNETADVYVVRQREAHSWVEVYFPGEDAWVPFDPTPAAGQNLGVSSGGFYGTVTKYLEAMEMIWIQYFVAFDNQEQRSLFTSIRRGISDYNEKTADRLGDARAFLSEWWAQLRGDAGSAASLRAIGWAAGTAAIFGLLIIAFVAGYRWALKWKVWARLRNSLLPSKHASIVEFYERMQEALASKGFVREPHQTPLEFAYAVGMPEAVKLTERYNRVRFGAAGLSRAEAQEIDEWLRAVADTSRDQK